MIRFENTQWRKVKGWAKGKCRIGQWAVITRLGLGNEHNVNTQRTTVLHWSGKSHDMKRKKSLQDAIVQVNFGAKLFLWQGNFKNSATTICELEESNNIINWRDGGLSKNTSLFQLLGRAWQFLVRPESVKSQREEDITKITFQWKQPKRNRRRRIFHLHPDV